MPTTHIDNVYVPEDQRIRAETYGDIERLAEMLRFRGQLQSILVRPASDDDETEAEWVLVDGGRRIRATRALLDGGHSIRDLEPGQIRYDLKAGQASDPLEHLLDEFYANEEREDFSWQEKATFVRDIHNYLEEQAEEKEMKWHVDLTASYLKMASVTVYKYLELTEDPEIFKSEEVQSADSYRTAHKKTQIAKDKKRREMKVALRKKREKETEDEVDEEGEPLDLKARGFIRKAHDLIAHADCREWIKTFDDNTFDWAHWDPPYGGSQEGGAFGTHEQIDDSPEYARSLQEEMIPELARVLSPGSWLAIWFHQSNREWLRDLLESSGFWVNPYECIWYKKNRKADGHEITRFLINAYEPFFLAGLPIEDEKPILPKTDIQNVFVFDGVQRSQRRHIMHKPATLLRRILHVIATRGSMGIDPSAGSGSIVEAAIVAGCDIKAAELSDTYHLASVEHIAQLLESRNAPVEVEGLDPIPDNFSI